MTFKSGIYASLVLVGAFVISSCKKEDDNTELEKAKVAVIANYANIVYATYSDAATKAIDLRTAIIEFVDNPSQANLTIAKQAYIDAREPYGQSDAFRFYGGPIDDDNGKEGLMNGWPLDENYIDYVSSNSSAGIINDSVNYPVISKEVIEIANEQGGETNISTGYHAIEFLLWGQDLSSAGPGVRPYTDYVQTVSKAANRRGQYLKVVADLLVDDLNYTKLAWTLGSSYRTAFELDIDKSIQLILTGIGKFTKGELFGERMSTAYDTQNQEDEHSCFSDQTHRDFILGEKGIHNVFFGHYTRIDGVVISGTGIYDLIKMVNAGTAEDAKNALMTAETAVAAIHAPFDNEIVDPAGRARVLTAIQAGNVQAQKIVNVANNLGTSIVL